MNPLDDGAIAYLKANGMYDAIIAQVAKQTPDVGDVHRSSATAARRKKPPATVEDEEPTANVTKALIAKFAAADPVFAKGDAGLYVYRPLLEGSAKRLHDWAVEAGMQNVVPPELMHVTQVHSKTAVDALDPVDTVLDLPAQPRWLSPLGDKGALVMFVDSPDMAQRFTEAAAAGAVWDFPSYRPHITLSYDAGPVEWSMMQPPDFPLQLGPEQFQGNNDTWVEDNGLRKVEEFEGEFRISKIAPEQQMVFGWASVSSVNGVEVIDKQDDIVPILELEKAAYEFVLYSREQGDMHAKRNVGRLVESVVFTPEKTALGLVAKDESGAPIMGWWTGFQISDPSVWKAHKEGRRPEFSIGGRATPVPQ